jgi:hypothetical protein
VGISPEAKEALRAAHLRIFSGQAKRNDRHTVSAWAEEAGVSLSTANRSQELKANFLAEAAAWRGKPTKTAPMRAKIADLERRLRERNFEYRSATGSMQVMAQHIQVLTLENEMLRQEIERLIQRQPQSVSLLRSRKPL